MFKINLIKIREPSGESLGEPRVNIDNLIFKKFILFARENTITGIDNFSQRLLLSSDGYNNSIKIDNYLKYIRNGEITFI